MPPPNLTCHPQPQRRRTTHLSTFMQTSSTMKNPPTLCWWTASRDGPSYHRQAAVPQASHRYSGRPLQHSASPPHSPLMEDPNSLPMRQEICWPAGESTTGFPRHTTPTRTTAPKQGSKPSSGSSQGTPTPGVP